ncbi:MAG: radical SAM protein [Lentimicrobium sp.]|nr:radical SAM protein [Lentimicrobium sp.]
MKHFTIPIFVPELACPNRCVFCNQHSISGCQKQPEPDEVREIILQHLKTIPENNSHIEIGFFGGSFTGIEQELQERYLAVANEFLVLDSGWSRLRSTIGNQESILKQSEETETLFLSGAETTIPGESNSGWSRLRSTTGNHKFSASPSEETETRWSSGADIRWSSGADIRWSSGADIRWSSGAETTHAQKRIHGIRLSTRPDYINPEALDRLKRYGVTTIELGAQSLNDEVLQFSGRGHSVVDVEKASELILSSGFKLGLQMMTGLPGDTPDISLQTARRIVHLGATCTRIYPTLVIRGTELEQRWRRGEYKPQSLDEAIELTARLLEIFKNGGVEVIRVGLHPSEGLLDGSELLAGPFHPSLRELVETYRWKQKLIPLLQQHPAGTSIKIPVTAEELRFAIGFNSSNRKILEEYFSKVEFIPELSPDQNRPLIITDKKLPLPAKNTLKTYGELVLLQTKNLVYKSINGHPDIFMCQGRDTVVVSPDLPPEILASIKAKKAKVTSGKTNPGRVYPDSARYNAVVTNEFIIHNLKITDPAIFEAFSDRKHLHVNQGYTRCNLLALDENHFITSDRGIEKVLSNEGRSVLYVDPASVRLRGQKHGFFPGCCGLTDNELMIAGSLAQHPGGDKIKTFINEAGFNIRELYNGPLIDVGGIFFF